MKTHVLNKNNGLCAELQAPPLSSKALDPAILLFSFILSPFAIVILD